MTSLGSKFFKPAVAAFGASLAALALPGQAAADNLYAPLQGGALTNDIKASDVGDILAVLIIQNAEARNSAQNLTNRSSGLNASATGTNFGEFADISLDRRFRGAGEVRRSESFATVMSASIVAVYPNGDYEIAGNQFMDINGEVTEIGVRGRIRAVDIGPDNTILSSRIANAHIRYDGEGFVSRSARPGLITRIFNTLGLF